MDIIYCDYVFVTNSPINPPTIQLWPNYDGNVHYGKKGKWVVMVSMETRTQHSDSSKISSVLKALDVSFFNKSLQTPFRNWQREKDFKYSLKTTKKLFITDNHLPLEMLIANQAKEPGVNDNDNHKKCKKPFKMFSPKNDKKLCP